jgi:DNA-binding PadR family transcriptional regulator
LRGLTALEQKIVSYLAEHPNSNIQKIQRGLGKEDRNYPSVYNAVLRLPKKGYVTSKKEKSKKAVIINVYRLTFRGFGWVMAHGNENLLLKAIEKQEDDHPSYNTLKELISYLKPSTAKKVLRMTGKLFFEYGEKASDLHLLSLMAYFSHGKFSKSQLRELRRAWKKVGALEKALQETAKTIHDFAFPKGDKEEESVY